MNEAKKYVTQFDSTTSMMYAVAACMHNKEFKGVGVVPDFLPKSIPMLLNLLPRNVREALYRWGGWLAAQPKRIPDIRSEDISAWVVSEYPQKAYPGAMIGSSNGAAAHLCVAMGMPWLPQTFLVTVRRHVHPDDLNADVEWGRRQAHTIRRANPDLFVSQMHDPVQDRLMVERMGYFRIKKMKLGSHYEDFLRKLPAGSPLFLVECRYQWPVTQVDEGHTFQIGGLGDIEPEEYVNGSERIREFLKKNGSPHGHWQAPAPTGEYPEAEWGFQSCLGDDAERFAKEAGFRIRRIRFEHPECLSPFVADLYRWWYRRRGHEPKHLIADCFAIMDPWWTLKTGAVPFWMAFNTRNSWRALDKYLKNSPPFEEIYMMLMSNGISGIGQVSIEDWKKLLGRATKTGDFLGVDEDKYPMDFGSFVRYHPHMRKKIKHRFPMPECLSEKELDLFMEENRGRHDVEII
jgi:hypothetical protein